MENKSRLKYLHLPCKIPSSDKLTTLFLWTISMFCMCVFSLTIFLLPKTVFITQSLLQIQGWNLFLHFFLTLMWLTATWKGILINSFQQATSLFLSSCFYFSLIYTSGKSCLPQTSKCKQGCRKWVRKVNISSTKMILTLSPDVCNG